MKKTLVVVVLAVLALGTAACESNSKTSSTKTGGTTVTTAAGTTVTTEAPTTTTTEDNSALVAGCLSTGNQLVDVSKQYVSTLSANVYVVVTEPTVRAAALNTGEQLSSTLRQWASTCRSVSSDAADKAVSLADSVDNLLSTLRSAN